MEKHIQRKSHGTGNGSQSMADLQPGRSMAPPALQLKAGAMAGMLGAERESGFLKGSVGRGGDNLEPDLRKMGQFLYEQNAPLTLVADLVNPGKNGALIERYQKEVLGFSRADGRIDPGGKTLAAILEMRGKDIVAGWYQQSVGAGKEGEAANVQAEQGEIPPVLSESQYFSQYDNGAPAVPMSFLRKNMGKHNSEKGYRNVACYHTCRYMLMQAGFTPGTKTDAEYLLKMQSSGDSKAGTFKKGISGLTSNFASSLGELDESLAKGVPVIAGVNKNTKNLSWTNSKTDGNVSPTDHFVVIIGKTVTSDGRVGYRYFDPARYSKANGTSPNNLLIQDRSGQLTGKPYGKHTYSLGEIRPTI